jgi:hypothetical protein
MLKKKGLLQNCSIPKKVFKRAAKKDATKKTREGTTGTFMKAPTSSKNQIFVATRAATAAVRRSIRIHKTKKLD